MGRLSKVKADPFRMCVWCRSCLRRVKLCGSYADLDSRPFTFHCAQCVEVSSLENTRIQGSYACIHKGEHDGCTTLEQLQPRRDTPRVDNSDAN